MRSDKIEELMDIYETLVDAGVTFIMKMKKFLMEK